MRCTAIALAVALGACDASHTRPDAAADVGAAADTLVDARDLCTVAGVARCDPGCGRNMSYCWGLSPDPEAFECRAGLCLPFEVGSMFEQGNGCGSDAACADERVCVLDRAFGGGACMPESFCDQAAAEGFPTACVWSDRTARVTGAPHALAACPGSSAAPTPFCGGPCGDTCRPYTADFHDVNLDVLNRGLCVGRSDLRELGICGPAGYCRRGERSPADACADTVTMSAQVYPELAGQTCVCIVFHDPATADGLQDFGFVNTEDGCRRYRALYPDAIECITDSDWHTLP